MYMKLSTSEAYLFFRQKTMQNKKLSISLSVKYWADKFVTLIKKWVLNL